MSKIIIADDHKIFRQGLKALILMEGIGDVIAEVSNGQELLDLLPNCSPDLILMDIEMPVINGVEATRKALELCPNLKILALSSFGDEVNYFSIVQAGAKGFILKTLGIYELQMAIAEVINGGSYFSSELLCKIITSINLSNETKSTNRADNIDHFSKRELEVLQLVSKELSNEEIADKMHISVTTVKGHRTNLLLKSGSKNTPGLIMYAIKNKIIVC